MLTSTSGTGALRPSRAACVGDAVAALVAQGQLLEDLAAAIRRTSPGAAWLDVAARVGGYAEDVKDAARGLGLVQLELSGDTDAGDLD